jgi:hypothetical protein
MPFVKFLIRSERINLANNPETQKTIQKTDTFRQVNTGYTEPGQGIAGPDSERDLIHRPSASVLILPAGIANQRVCNKKRRKETVHAQGRLLHAERTELQRTDNDRALPMTIVLQCSKAFHRMQVPVPTV